MSLDFTLKIQSGSLRAPSHKLQAASDKLQATSYKLQATSLRVKGKVKQQALNVLPIIVCEGRCFSVIYQQTVDRFTLIKFYGARRGIFEQDKITFCPCHMK
jgi:hypothetical protein